MPIALVTGPANAGKAQVVLDAVRAHAAHGANPLLVVPTEADQARYRRELAESGVAMGVRVERFAGLFDEAMRRSKLAQAPLGRTARKRLLASLAADRLADEGAAGRGLVDALAELVAELEVARVTPARLRAALVEWRAQGVRSLSMEGVCDVFDAYQQALAGMGRADLELCATRALDELRRRPSLWGDTPVLLYGFDSFTELQLDTIETLGTVVDTPLTVSLAYEPGRRAFAGRAAALQRLKPQASSHTELPPRAEYYAPASRAALHHLERSLFEEHAPRVTPVPAVRLLEGSSPRGELELIASEARALIEQGFAAEEIAIVHRSPDAVSALLAEALEEARVPHSLGLRARFSHTAIGRGLLGLMRCALADGQLSDLLAWLRTPGVLSHPELADRLEAQARRRGAASVEQARALWEAEHWPLDRIERLQARARQGTEELLIALSTELERLFAAPRRGLGEVLGHDERMEARALTAGRRALEELRELARIAPEHAGGPRELIALLGELELFESGRALADAVALVDPLSLRARRVRALFVCGMQEGVFPAPAAAQPLLGREERRQLALASGLVLPGDSSLPAGALDSERYLLYALCSRPEELLVLSWHTSSEDGSPLARSLFVDDVCDLFAESLEREIVREPAPQDSLGGACEPALQESLAGAREPALQESLAGAREPASIQPLSDERVLAELRERALWSASALEAFNACPVRWFVERVLRAQALDPDPEPLVRGALAHAALRQTLEGLREQTGSARLTASSLPHAKRLLEQALYDGTDERPLSVRPARAPGARRRLHSELERYLEWAAERDDELEPTYFELEFGFDQSALPALKLGFDESAPPALELGDEVGALPAFELGDDVRVRGRIDRIDLSPSGEAVVYDYKARVATPAAKWTREGALQVALYMRAAERLLDHRRVAAGFYQPLAGKDLRPRGVLDADSSVEIECFRTDRRERAELRELLAECEAIALDAARQARAGAIEPRPASCSYNGGCMYPTICRCVP